MESKEVKVDVYILDVFAVFYFYTRRGNLKHFDAKKCKITTHVPECFTRQIYLGLKQS